MPAPAPELAREPAQPASSAADLDAALRALHIATIHLEQAAAGPDSSVLVVRSRALVRQATTLLAAAARSRRHDSGH